MPDKNGELTYEEIWEKYGYKPPKPWSAKGKKAGSPKKDCFGYLPPRDGSFKGNKELCTALNRLYCVYEECSFYKPYDLKGLEESYE